jgi:hypothetical protein
MKNNEQIHSWNLGSLTSKQIKKLKQKFDDVMIKYHAIKELQSSYELETDTLGITHIRMSDGMNRLLALEYLVLD